MKKTFMKALSAFMAAALLAVALTLPGTALVKNAAPLAEVPEGYTAITTAAQLDAVRSNLSGKYILMNDIDLASFGNWTPIGSSAQPFTGILDGNGYAIINLSTETVVKGENGASTGLVSYSKSATVSNLTLENIDIRVDESEDISYSVGGIAANAKFTTFNNCSVSGSICAKVGGRLEMGGIVGYLNGSRSIIVNCENLADITAEASGRIFVGGIVGSTNERISVCRNVAGITVNNIVDSAYELDMIFIGGICGMTTMNLSDNCYNSGSIESKAICGSLFAGGICGASGSLYCCYNVGGITFPQDAKKVFVGAVSGVVDSKIDLYGTMMDSFILKNCYYSLADLPAAGDASPNSLINVKYLTAEEMKDKANFNDYNFTSMWQMSETMGRPVFISEKNHIVSVEIEKIPFLNRIVFGLKHPKSENIKLKLNYGNGESISSSIERTGEFYHIAGERVEMEMLASGYGIKTETLYIGSKRVEVSYKYFSIPNLFEIVPKLYTILQSVY